MRLDPSLDHFSHSIIKVEKTVKMGRAFITCFCEKRLTSNPTIPESEYPVEFLHNPETDVIDLKCDFLNGNERREVLINSIKHTKLTDKFTKINITFKGKELAHNE